MRRFGEAVAFWISSIGISVVLLSAFISPLRAAELQASFTNLCDQAASRAAENVGVPVPILLAITRTETARNGMPWPWTMNIDGRGRWFSTREDAVNFAADSYDSGVRSFDIGCFQINHRWHGENFTSIRAMFDPDTNATYAARYLVSLFEEFGAWDQAVGAYHSRTPRHATRYVRIYHNYLVDLGVDSDFPPPSGGRQDVEVGQPPSNSFPLLQTGRAASAGSLMPRQETQAQPLFAVRP